MKKNLHLTVLLAAGALTLTNCATTEQSTGTRENTLIPVAYGTVSDITQVDMKANTAGGAALGGGVGLAAASGHSSSSKIAATAAGALIGALIQKSRQTTADQYTVDLKDGGTFEIVSEHHDIAVGDCVSLEQGQHANIRRVSPVMCNMNANHSAYSELHAANVGEADECHQAKQELLNAKTEQETNIGYTKMRALCET